MFDWVFNTSLFIQDYFLLLSNETTTSINDLQANTVGKDIDPVTSLRLNFKDGSENLVRRRGEGKHAGYDWLLFKLAVKLLLLEILYSRFYYYKVFIGLFMHLCFYSKSVWNLWSLIIRFANCWVFSRKIINSIIWLHLNFFISHFSQEVLCESEES